MFLLQQIYPQTTEFVRIVLDGLRTCLPGPIAHYTLTLAKAMLEVIDTPNHSMFSTVCNFLLKKPRWKEECLLLYETLGSVDKDLTIHCLWMLEILQNGVQSMHDWSIVRKRHVASLLYRCYLMCAETKVAEVISHWTRHVDICVDLVVHHGLLGFLAELDSSDRDPILSNIHVAVKEGDWSQWYVEIQDVEAVLEIFE
jgi:hypothetical protein